MKIERLKNRKALSPVISALILSASVLVIGGAVWSFSQSAMTITTEEYTTSMINTMETISERFIIEHVAYDNPDLKVWVYNHGIINIEVKIQVEKEGVIVIPYGDFIPIIAGDFKELMLLNYPDANGELVITACTRREKTVYYKYLVPS